MSFTFFALPSKFLAHQADTLEIASAALCALVCHLNGNMIVCLSGCFHFFGFLVCLLIKSSSFFNRVCQN